jgi:PTH1 family peptidyl-tRNA hydrolase
MQGTAVSGKLKLIFGIGNHLYPRSRHSVGLYMVSRFAEVMGAKWESRPDLGCDISIVGRLLLVRPTTYYISQNARPLRRVSQEFQVPLHDTFIVHHDLDLPVGSWKEQSGGLIGENTGLRQAMKALRTKMFSRVAIGVGKRDAKLRRQEVATMREYTDEKTYRDLFAYSPVPPEDLPLLQRAEEHILQTWRETQFMKRSYKFTLGHGTEPILQHPEPTRLEQQQEQQPSPQERQLKALVEAADGPASLREARAAKEKRLKQELERDAEKEVAFFLDEHPRMERLHLFDADIEAIQRAQGISSDEPDYLPNMPHQGGRRDTFEPRVEFSDAVYQSIVAELFDLSPAARRRLFPLLPPPAPSAPSAPLESDPAYEVNFDAYLRVSRAALHPSVTAATTSSSRSSSSSSSSASSKEKESSNKQAFSSLVSDPASSDDSAKDRGSS